MALSEDLNTLLASPDIHRFSHAAMATTYEIVIYGEDNEYASQAAWAAWQLLEQLEEDLSRYRPNSDISRVNALQPGEVIPVGPDAFACLQACKMLFEETGGLFDVTAGGLITAWREAAKTGAAPEKAQLDKLLSETGMQQLFLHEATFSVAVSEAPVTVDLGGYGKGYAVDQMSELLADEWEIETFLIHGGSSSVLARGKPGSLSGWPISISHPRTGQTLLPEILLEDTTLSGSGIQKGQHIIDPRTGQAVQHQDAAWVLAESAAIGDALSTTLMICSIAEAEVICRNFEGITALLLAAESDQLLELPAKGAFDRPQLS